MNSDNIKFNKIEWLFHNPSSAYDHLVRVNVIPRQSLDDTRFQYWLRCDFVSLNVPIHIRFYSRKSDGFSDVPLPFDLGIGFYNESREKIKLALNTPQLNYETFNYEALKDYWGPSYDNTILNLDEYDDEFNRIHINRCGKSFSLWLEDEQWHSYWFYRHALWELKRQDYNRAKFKNTVLVELLEFILSPDYKYFNLSSIIPWMKYKP